MGEVTIMKVICCNDAEHKECNLFNWTQETDRNASESGQPESTQQTKLTNEEKDRNFQKAKEEMILTEKMISSAGEMVKTYRVVDGEYEVASWKHGEDWEKDEPKWVKLSELTRGMELKIWFHCLGCGVDSISRLSARAHGSKCKHCSSKEGAKKTGEKRRTKYGKSYQEMNSEEKEIHVSKIKSEMVLDENGFALVYKNKNDLKVDTQGNPVKIHVNQIKPGSNHYFRFFVNCACGERHEWIAELKDRVQASNGYVCKNHGELFDYLTKNGFEIVDVIWDSTTNEPKYKEGQQKEFKETGLQVTKKSEIYMYNRVSKQLELVRVGGLKVASCYKLVVRNVKTNLIKYKDIQYILNPEREYTLLDFYNENPNWLFELVNVHRDDNGKPILSSDGKFQLKEIINTESNSRLEVLNSSKDHVVKKYVTLSELTESSGEQCFMRVRCCGTISAGAISDRFAKANQCGHCTLQGTSRAEIILQQLISRIASLIHNSLHQNNQRFIPNPKSTQNLEADICFSYNGKLLFISEFDGNFHDNPDTVIRDLVKSEWALENQVHLFRFRQEDLKTKMEEHPYHHIKLVDRKYYKDENLAEFVHVMMDQLLIWLGKDFSVDFSEQIQFVKDELSNEDEMKRFLEEIKVLVEEKKEKYLENQKAKENAVKNAGHRAIGKRKFSFMERKYRKCA